MAPAHPAHLTARLLPTLGSVCLGTEGCLGLSVTALFISLLESTVKGQKDLLESHHGDFGSWGLPIPALPPRAPTQGPG